MKISTRGRYSLRMMIDLAQHYNDGFITLKDISERQDISKKYLEQIIPLLNRSNLLQSNKGHMGGYKLSRTPAEITVREILESAEGSLTLVSSLLSLIYVFVTKKHAGTSVFFKTSSICSVYPFSYPQSKVK